MFFTVINFGKCDCYVAGWFKLVIVSVHLTYIQAVAGLLADSRQIVEIAREEASNYRYNYGTAIPLKVRTCSELLHHWLFSS